VTALFTEYTGAHDALPLDWTIKPSALNVRPANDTPAEPVAEPAAVAAEVARAEAPPSPALAGVLEIAKALNRMDPAALELAAGSPPDAPIDGAEVRKLIGTFWFGSVFPRFSSSWRERMLDALVESVSVSNHVLRRGRQTVKLEDVSYDEMREIAPQNTDRSAAAADLRQLLAIASLWGEDALKRIRFVEMEEPAGSQNPSRLASLFGMRG
jgi:hypothetical protein